MASETVVASHSSIGVGSSELANSGYVRLPAFLTDADLAATRADVKRLHAAPRDTACARPHNKLLPLQWSDPIVGLVLGSSARIARLRTAARAEDLRWISGYVSSKEPQSGPLGWHQDWWCWGHPVSFRRAPVQVALLCYLADTDPTNGALRVLPGSHLRSVELHAELPEAHTTDPSLDPDDPAASDQPEQVTITLGAGDAVVLDYRLLHGTHANRSDRRRDCLLLSFAPSWRDLPDDVRGHLISHPALPPSGEVVAAAWATDLLPTFNGRRSDLPLDRVPPAGFKIA
jgi:hypothetical protein